MNSRKRVLRPSSSCRWPASASTLRRCEVAHAFLRVCFVLGFASGYWAVFVTVASEQFGTNLRATATTTAPNFVRGAVVPMTLLFQALREPLGPLAGRPHGGPADGDNRRRGAVGSGRDLRSGPRLRRGLIELRQIAD